MPDQTRNLNSVTDFTGTLDSNDRIIMTDNKASLKALTTAILGKAMIEGYTGSSLAGSSQSVKSAIDGLNSELTLTGGYNYAESFSSAEILGSKLDALLNAQSSYVIGCYRLSCTASFGVFQNGYDYYVQMTRANSLNFVMAEFTPIDNALIKILGKRRTEGWSFELAPSRTEINTLNSKIPTIVTDASDTITATGCTVDKVYIVRVGAVLYASIRFTTTEDIAISSLILDGFPRALTNYTGAQNVRLYDHTSERFFDAQITHSDGASKSYLSSMEAIPSGHQIRGTFSYIASF